MQPLKDVTVVDFSRYLSGPYCTMLLADYGADVIKIERPGDGDEARAMAPIVNGESYSAATVNRNKRSIALDLSTAAGQALARELIQRADVVVENFRPGVMERLGLSFDDVRPLNPDMIYCSITGFGQTGPNSHRAGFDIIAQGMAGFLRMTGPPGGEPAKFGVAITDLAAGMTAAVAVLAAYIRRLREGGGQYIDVSLLDAGLALTVWESASWFGAKEEPLPAGSRHRLNAPYQAFRTADGYVTIGANNQRLWERLCREVLDRPDLLEVPEYADSRSRPAHADRLADDLQPVLLTRTTDYWVQALDRAGVPGGPVLTYGQAIEQPQVLARDMVLELEHPVIGRMKLLGMPAKMSETPPTLRCPAPLLGEHSREVARLLGHSDDEIAGWLADGTLAEPRGRPEETDR